MQVCALTEFQLLIFGIWLQKCSIIPKTDPIKPRIRGHMVDFLHHTTSSKRTKNQTKAPTTHDSSDLFHVDDVPSNAKFSQSNAMLCVFEDNEAVIKMLIKGRGPTMGHVSRTLRVAFDWLFDSMNLDPKIQIRYIDTEHQIADILTKRNFTRDEWNILLHLLTSAISARRQGMLNLDESTGRLVAADKDQKYVNQQEKISPKEPVALGYEGYPGNLQISEDSEDSEPERSNLATSFPKITTLCWDDLKDLDVNTAIWCFFTSVTLQAAVHLGQDYSQNLRSIQNQPSKCVEQFFRTTEKLIKDQVEITGLSTIDWNHLMWSESSLLCDKAVHIMKSKTYVFAHSVLCLGSICDQPAQAWKNKIKWYLERRYLQRCGPNRRGTDGIRVEGFPRIHYVGNSRRDSKDDGGIEV